MKTYTLIGAAVQAHSNASAAKAAIASAEQEPKLMLRSQEDLAGAEISGKQLVDIWNGFAGVEPVKKFTSRKIAVERIWKEVEKLEPETVADNAPRLEKAAKRRVKPGEGTEGATAAKASKKSAVLDLLRSPEGATLGELMTATGWQAHSVRGFLSGTVRKKMGLEPKRVNRDGGEKAYRLES